MKKKWLYKAIKEANRGVGVVEVILILVILIGLVVIFKSEIEALVGTVFDAISGKTDTILS